MRRQIALAPVVLVAALSLSIALVDRIKERVAQDRLSVGDSSATEPLSRRLSLRANGLHPRAGAELVTHFARSPSAGAQAML